MVSPAGVTGNLMKPVPPMLTFSLPLSLAIQDDFGYVLNDKSRVEGVKADHGFPSGAISTPRCF